MDTLEQNAITQLLSLEDRDSQNRWDVKSPPIQQPKVKSLNQIRKKKICQSMEQKQIVEQNNELHFEQFPKIHQKEHSFRSLMDKYFKILNQKNNQKQNILKSTRLRQSSIIESSEARKIKRSHHELLIQDMNINQQIKLSELCKDIMIYRPVKNYSQYLPRLKPQVFRMK